MQKVFWFNFQFIKDVQPSILSFIASQAYKHLSLEFISSNFSLKIASY